jgi:serine/threonine protein kinase/Flp pilus assembly protein TadD
MEFNGSLETGVGGCPSRAGLSAFRAGELPEDALKRVAAHVSECTRCAETLREIDERDEALIAKIGGGAVEKPFLHEPGCAALMDRVRALANEQAPGQLGDFRLLREVGRGGMGVVYEAEQLSLGRRVALKVLPFAATMDPRQLQRFHNEARAAAGLHHEHITPVYFVGCERGVHFYAMQFIDGHTLTDVAACRDGLPTPSDQPTAAPAGPAADTVGAAADPTAVPRDAAYYRRVAAWGIQAAEALEHAHSCGVVHRDVKPGNLMVDGQGKLWVTDFGLARLGADSGLTMTGDLLGTLRYMSPEQALAQHGLVDHRTDIYSLGATLYELLTHTPAVGGRDREEVLRKIAFEEPKPPRWIERGIPADLETIVLKALAKDPTERYATARELAEDLRRFLEHRPVLARRPTLAQRAGKWVQRHRRLTGAVLVLVLVALAGLATSTALIWAEQSRTEIAKQEAQEKKKLAEKQAAEAKKQTAKAKAQQRRAEDNLRTVLGMVRNQEDLLEIIRNNPQIGVRPEQMTEWTGQFVKGLEKLKEDRLDDPEHLERLAGAHWRFGEALAELGRFTEAEAAYRDAISLYASVGADFPAYRHASGARSTVPHLHRNLAEVQRAGGRLAEAEESYRQALRLVGTLNFAKGNLGPEGVFLSGLARCLLAAGRVKEAERLYRRALQISPGKDDVRLGWAWFLATRPDAGHRDPGRAVEFAKAGGALVFSGSDVLGVAQYRAGDWKAAVATLGGAVQTHFGRENGAGFFLAMAHWQLGEKDRARQRYQEALAWTYTHRPKDKELLRFRAEAARLLGVNEHLGLAGLCVDKRRFAAAARHYSAAFAAEPKLAENLSPSHRQGAAICAVRAVCGLGEDAARLDEKERARLRQQALDWLRAELALWGKQLEGSPRSAPQVRQEMEGWQRYSDFAGVRDREALAKLPKAERDAWRKFWADVAATLARAQKKGTPAEQKVSPREAPKKD